MKHTKSDSKKAGTAGSFCLLAAVLAFAVIMIPLAYRAAGGGTAEDAPASPGLCVLAEKSPMAVAGLVGSSISLDASDFARAANLASVSSVTVTSLPPITDGELRVGNTVLTNGQTVSGSALSLLTYTAASGITSSSFGFCVGDSPVEMTCNLYLLERPNGAPTVSAKVGSGTPLRTYGGNLLYGTLSCSDPEGDETRIEIVSYPKQGSLILTDAATGSYTYLAADGAEGRDSFTYVAGDRYGNYSPAVTVELEILRAESSVVYADLVGSPYANAAVAATDAGLMSGTQVGAMTYFKPDLEVTRAEFTKMAMCALGMTQVSYGETVFSDNAEIPSELRGYVATAYELKYLSGIADGEGALRFEPNRAITRAEAAVMLGSMMELAAPTVAPVFSDSDEIPVWAAPAIHSLHAAGMLESGADGAILPTAAMTRGEVAELLFKMLSAR